MADSPFSLSCPTPLSEHDTVQLAHGGGGRLMRGLIEGLLLPNFGLPSSQPVPHDSTVLDIDGLRLAFTTDTFVVTPLFFPGGDIGKLAVYGTVNDLAMSGAIPRYLSCGLVLEEGTPMDTVRRVVDSMRHATEEVGVQIVTGDTKVVDRGKGDGIFINTSGIGTIEDGIDISPTRVHSGDKVIVSGDVGRHGIAIMSVREGLEFDGAPESDCASLADLVQDLTPLRDGLHCLRDLTRGGLAAALVEIAEHAAVGIEVHEPSIPIHPGVGGACELLGLDPNYVANEGRLVAIVAAPLADRAVSIMKSHALASQARVVGTVVEGHAGEVEIFNSLGSSRILDLLSGEQMPRIC